MEVEELRKQLKAACARADAEAEARKAVDARAAEEAKARKAADARAAEEAKKSLGALAQCVSFARCASAVLMFRRRAVTVPSPRRPLHCQRGVCRASCIAS